MNSATELHRFASTPVSSVTPAFRHTSPRYIGLRVSRYGPRATRSGTGVNGQTPTPCRLNSRSAQTLRAAPASRRTPPAIMAGAEGRSGRPASRSGSWAASAIRSPFGGSTCGRVSAYSVMAASFEQCSDVAEGLRGGPGPAGIDPPADPPQHDPVDPADLLPQRPALVGQAQQDGTGVVGVGPLLDPGGVSEPAQRLMDVLAAH